MSKRTWACVECKQKYRRDQNSDKPVKCATCGKVCEYVHWKVRVPSPKKEKDWKKFWAAYLKEKALLEKYYNDESVEEITLDILNMRLIPRVKRNL
ncbi:hypothetical protein Kalk_11660 [Ketobacter alkanivorans]|uniref:Uncharacterized protein n=1 Tax=Ketobacter alkanivorans TaxID=1917421 RepID=A0A2K9LL32_9GAMM|nr:hypothetical protein Kalk_11660 [Ketobacter alkanivorans]